MGVAGDAGGVGGGGGVCVYVLKIGSGDAIDICVLLCVCVCVRANGAWCFLVVKWREKSFSSGVWCECGA